ncbi:putative spermatogenesis-associated protein 17-like [Trypanosoma rangeli]|uniref:Putative spermatogenesis-associated protein 17-like n=1 Tax=Trypanosoma rangeli TaxID=5698 RepID=A0A3R7MN93_TRYRA|nr:putative spermatogenesis-associated protein 17-like [Trypanosoma rangeli]RNF08641.1 putative spermatogenesis-associated protein 17-like [Trypanosoma rangeli]|eukprot:RNF08641.1 putative spermatogenesis-associated protein 17-like [Trypanosoma rangeli]
MDNFYARKLYIEETVKASLQVQEMATQLFHEQVERDTETRRLQQEKSYKEATEKLRHLVSTVSVSGIYRRPMVPCLTMSVYGTCVEDDIRRNGEAALHLEHIRKMRGTLTTGRRERQKTGVASATTEESGFPTNKQVQGGVGAKGQGNVSTLPVLRGAWNRSCIDGQSLPRISVPFAGNGRKNLGVIKCHSCIDGFEPMYDTETAALLRSIDAKEIQALHGSKPFVVHAPRRVPL